MIDFISKLPHTADSVFSVMSNLAAQHNAINLSQGFPDFDCPPELIELVNRYMKEGRNQYAPMPGVLSLREAISEKMMEIHQSKYNADTEITITAGATQAIFSVLAATINPNDEVIIFEPAYDCYSPVIKLFGGIVKPFEMAPPDYKIDWDVVKRMVTANTRMIIINSPQNPNGRLFSESDILELTELAESRDLLILSDEVYEHIVFDGKKHLSLAQFPKLKKRTFITASFGKLFHNTGWKMGYCLAPERLMSEFRKVHQFQVFSVNTPIQHAIADFIQNRDYYLSLNDFFQRKRDLFAQMLAQTKLTLLPCEGSYFQCVTYGNISDKSDFEFASDLVKTVGVAAIPVSAFYSRKINHGVLRFCFAKKDETLESAVERLLKL